MEKKKAKDLIVSLIGEKSVTKQDVYANTISAFEQLKQVLEEVSDELKSELLNVDERININYRTKGSHEAQLSFAGDVLVFQMHTNIFSFDQSHAIWKSSYVNDDSLRAYCGVINIYNFLNDSLKYNRYNDSGYLVARIYVNKDNHFFVEGKRQLGFLYNDFISSTIDKQSLRNILESAMLYTLDFDLLSPPYDTVKEITVHESLELTNNAAVKTAKRLGFQFETDKDIK